MAMKDWKEREEDWWIKKDKSVMIVEAIINKKEIGYGVRLSTGGFNNIPQTSLKKVYKFKTKSQAMAYAKAYMRTH